MRRGRRVGETQFNKINKYEKDITQESVQIEKEEKEIQKKLMQKWKKYKVVTVVIGGREIQRIQTTKQGEKEL